MSKKIYKRFKPENLGETWKDAGWAVVTDDEEELSIAVIPKYIKHPKAVATALSSALNESRYALTDLI